MNPVKCDVVKGNELDSAAAELELVIQRMAEREGEEREKLTKRYTSMDEKEVISYERGYSDGFRDGCQDCWGKGFDAGLKQAAAEEQKDKKKKKEVESD